jgi:CPA2 family monovalent cation:H+ antiporter-2
MDFWSAVLDILILLGAAMLLGALCERLKQSALLGYLLAGSLLGPNSLNVLPSHEMVSTVAELGIALLLFSIGLEFSWRRLRSVGAIAAGGGTLQILLTGAATALLCRVVGLDGPAALAIGAIVAMSSTAAVLRVLAGRQEIDAVHGRNALGILLLQDMAVVPAALFVAALGVGGGFAQVGWAVVQALGLATALAGTLYLLVSYGLPRLLGAELVVTNRDLSILLAIVTATGTAWLSHALGFSPVLGAFVAGMVLAESPFATQIRADIAPLHTLFVRQDRRHRRRRTPVPLCTRPVVGHRTGAGAAGRVLPRPRHPGTRRAGHRLEPVRPDRRRHDRDPLSHPLPGGARPAAGDGGRPGHDARAQGADRGRGRA